MAFQKFPGLRIRLFFNKIRDILIADLMYTFPSAVRWFYRLIIKQQMSSFLLHEKQNEVSETGILYLHKDNKAMRKENCAVLMLHGVYGHPFSMLHLADIALEENMGPVFSLHLPYNEHHPEIHRALLRQALDQIERIILENGRILRGIVTVGHSLGAIESAYGAFVDKDQRIMAVISIAGRLRVVPSLHQGCHESLRPTVEIVYQGILEQPDFPLYQIVAENDWNAPLAATAVRPDDDCCHIVADAMHLNVLFHQETRIKFREFLKKSSL